MATLVSALRWRTTAYRTGQNRRLILSARSNASSH